MPVAVWKGIGYQSMEHCRISAEGDIINIRSRILGVDEGHAYSVAYDLTLSNNWDVLRFSVDFSVDDHQRTITGIRQDDNWLVDGSIDQRFTGFKYIDITLTPFTNTLPIRNLALQDGQEAVIDVIYINILENDIYPVKQNYWRNSATGYRFQNVPNDFEADIDVDDSGLVVNYPSLFERLI